MKVLEKPGAALLNWTGGRLTSVCKARAQGHTHRSENRREGPSPATEDFPSVIAASYTDVDTFIAFILYSELMNRNPIMMKCIVHYCR